MSKINSEDDNEGNSGECFTDEHYRRVTEAESEFHCRRFLPKIAGTYKGVAVITGGGKTMWEDLEGVRSLTTDFDIIAINMTAMFIPEATHVYSAHLPQLVAWMDFRRTEFGGNGGDKAISHSGMAREGINWTWYIELGCSTSGLTAVGLAHLLGYDKIILCGVPQDGSGYFYKPSINENFGDHLRAIEIAKVKHRLGYKVRSMSGRTKISFESPTREWLNETND